MSKSPDQDETAVGEQSRHEFVEGFAVVLSEALEIQPVRKGLLFLDALERLPEQDLDTLPALFTATPDG